MRVIPAIDLKDGKCVRLFKGDFTRSTEYSSDPAAVGRRFSELSVQDLHVIDLDGARTGAQHNQAIVKEIVAHSGLEVQLGGGIRERDNIASWLDAGVTRCVVGSIAIKDPRVVKEWIAEFGVDAIVLALDINLSETGTPLLTTHGWTKDTDIVLWDCIDSYCDAGIRHVLCTDVARDGAMTGPNLELYADILARYPDLQLQASGGVRDIADLQKLRSLKLPAAITGRALLDGKISDSEVALFRQSA
jgi:phosphoribosylformimino-5-aminoimidazole carboxamide ribotide isomerase